MSLSVKRAFVGRPMQSTSIGDTLLPKWLALPVFCSDPLSSVAYATEQILLVLVLGGTAALAYTPFVALAVMALLVVVVWSYRQTVHAYPDGGGAYAVSKRNLGQSSALVAAAALLVDYVLTVAVSVAAGVANVIAAIPALDGHAVGLSLGFIALLTAMNLRGVKESGTAFAIPTYGFVASVLLLLVVALAEGLSGHPVTAASANYPVDTAALSGLAAVFLVLRAFASGCTALTGVEAISNGVPHFRKPKSRNASLTLLGMGVLAVTMFGGITLLAITSHVHIAENPADLGLPTGSTQVTVIAQLGQAVFGASSVGFYLLQAFTAAILILAANTAYNGFPILAGLLGRDGFLPRQFGRRGDRLVYSNGIVALAVVAGALVYAFDASTTRLIQLYILGVFLSFTLSQLGMVVHWNRELASASPDDRRSMLRSRVINGVGATMTALVLVVVLVTKFTHGAWIVVVAVPVLVTMMLAIKRHYRRTDADLVVQPGGMTLPSRVHSFVLVSRLNAPTMQALAYARATRPSSLVGLHVHTDDEETRRLVEGWASRDIPIPLMVVDSPYRDITTPVLEHIGKVHRESPRDVVTVFIPEYVVRHWWEHALHNQSALRLKARLLFSPGVMVTSVPTVIGEVDSRVGTRVSD